MTDLASIAQAAAEDGLEILGGFHPKPQDGAPDGCETLLILGPREPGYWARVQTSPEAQDGGPDPVDRWSRRVVGALATRFAATPLFPFGGPPYQPFIAWAQRTGQIWASPITLLVHDAQGLMVSFRGALALREQLSLPPVRERPCNSCKDRPCMTACPVDALRASGYDTTACHEHLNTTRGQTCMVSGCLARRACPISQEYGRLDGQSAYHMRQFHP